MLTPEQRQTRYGLITSSTAAACLGKHPYMTARGAQRHIKCLDMDEDSSSPATVRGEYCEDGILRWCADEYGLHMEPQPFVKHPCGYIGDSVDAVYTPGADTPEWMLTDKYILGEAKSVSMGVVRDWGDEHTEQIPTHIRIQCNIHLMCHPDADICLVPALFGDWGFGHHLYYVSKDADFEAKILKALGRWHERYIVGDETPPVEGDDCDWLRTTWQRDERKELEDTDTQALIAEAAARHSHASTMAKRYSDSKDLASAEIMDALKDCGSAGDIERFKVTWRNDKDSKTTDWKAVALDCAAGMTLEDATIKHTDTKAGPRVLRVRKARS